MHITLRIARDLPSLRTKPTFKAVKISLSAGSDRNGFRLVHFSVQKDHLHLIAEATNESVLSRGVQGLEVRIAKTVNRLWNRKGRVFADRYHARALKTPRETRICLAYVLLNFNHHAHQRGLPKTAYGIDLFSSGHSFDGWTDPPLGPSAEPPATSSPATWLLRTGWRRCGLLSSREVPGINARPIRARRQRAVKGL